MTEVGQVSLQQESHPSGILHLTPHAEFGNGGVGLLEYGSEDGPKRYFRFSVYRRTGARADQRECMALTAERWQMIADRLCALANEILEKNRLKPEQIVPILMKFHNLDRDYGIHLESKKQITYDRSKQGNYQQLHKRLMEAYQDYRPSGFQSFANESGTEREPLSSTRRGRTRTKRMEEDESRSHSRSPSPSHSRSRSPSHSRSSSRDPRPNPIKKGDSPDISRDEIMSFETQGTEAFRLIRTEELIYDHELTLFSELERRSRLIDLGHAQQVPKCPTGLPRSLYREFLLDTRKDVIRDGNIILREVFYSPDNNPRTARTFWIAMYTDTPKKMEVFLPFAHNSGDQILQHIYLPAPNCRMGQETLAAYLEKNNFTGQPYPTFKRRRLYEQELSLERAMAFLFLRAQEHPPEELITDAMKLDDNYLEGLDRWLLHERVGRASIFPEKIMKKRQLLDARCRLNAKDTPLQFAIIPIEISKSSMFRRHYEMQYISYYCDLNKEERNRTIHLRLPPEFQGQQLQSIKVKTPEGHPVLLLDYLRDYEGLSDQSVKYTVNTSPLYLPTRDHEAPVETRNIDERMQVLAYELSQTLD